LNRKHFSKFSPLNNQIKLEEDAPYYCFFSFAQLGPLFSPTRQVITFHLLPNSDELEATLRDVVHRSFTLSELLENLASLDELFSPVLAIHRLVAGCLWDLPPPLPNSLSGESDHSSTSTSSSSSSSSSSEEPQSTPQEDINLSSSSSSSPEQSQETSKELP